MIPMKFLCDQMLGTLAKWLRIFGYDTVYADNKVDDNKLIEIAKKENRVFITRDRELIWRCRRNRIEVIEIKSVNLDEQIKQVLNKVNFDKEQFLSRCTICNTPVEEIGKEKVKNQVPEKVYENNDQFWYCPNCNRIYWKGSHFDKMIKKIDKIR